MRKFFIQTASVAVGVTVAIGIAYACWMLAPFTLTQGHAGSFKQIDYADLIALLLTGVTVVLGALGFVVAILAFVGWNSIQGRVEDQTERLIEESLQEDGELKEIVKASLKKGGALYKLVQEEADRIIYSGIEPVYSIDEDEGKDKAQRGDVGK